MVDGILTNLQDWQCLACQISWVHLFLLSKEGTCLVESDFFPTIVGVSWLSKQLIGSILNPNKLCQISSYMFVAILTLTFHEKISLCLVDLEGQATGWSYQFFNLKIQIYYSYSIFCVKLQFKYFNSLEQHQQCAKSMGFDNSCKK